MRIVNQELYLHWSDLAQYGFDSNTLKKPTLRYRNGESSSYENIPDPQDQRLNLIKYDSIPRREQLLPSKDKLLTELRSSTLKNLAVPDSAAKDFYMEQGLDAFRSEQYSEQAAWFMLCAPLNRTQARSMGYQSVDEFYNDVIAYTLKEEILVITNLASFKRKMKPFNQLKKALPAFFDPGSKQYYRKQTTRPEQYETALSSLISGKLGKRNAAKLRPRNDERGARQAEEMQSEIIKLKSSPAPKLSDEQVWAFYIQAAKKKYQQYLDTDGVLGWDDKCLITVQTCKNFIRDSRQVWIAKRDGIKDYNNEFKLIIDRKRESRANAKWIIDGTPLHMYFMRDGKPYQRMNLFLVLDGHSYCVLGYSLSFNENSSQVLQALRMACQNAGHLPDELQSDNGRAINNWHVKHAIESITPRWIPAEVGNARAKKIESFFGHFDDRVLKFIPGYTGNPFAKMSTTRPNIEHVQSMIKNGEIPEFIESWNLIEQGLNRWNEQMFDKAYPIEKYQKSLKATASVQRKFTHSTDVEAFWHMPGQMRQFDDMSGSKRKKVSLFVPTEYEYTNRGIVIEKTDGEGAKQKHIFNVPDAAFNFLKIGQKFRIKLEPENWSKAYLYSGDKPICDQDGKPLEVLPKKLFASAKVDQLPGENEEWHQMLKVQKDQKELADQTLSRYMKVNKEAELIESAIESQNIYGGKDAINEGKSKVIEGLSRYERGAKKGAHSDTAHPHD
ncbi:MAG: DDE-type integrase/transposase/recombinase [Cyclobacteriaceae bacterium]